MERIKNDPGFRLAVVMLFAIVQFSWAYGYYSDKFSQGGIIDLNQTPVNLTGHFIQVLIVAVPMIAAFILSVFFTGKDFLKSFLLEKPDEKSRKPAVVLFVTAVLLLLAALVLKEQKLVVIYQWMYYFFLIGFLEEFVFRGVFPKILDGKLQDEWIWLTPNILFGLMHGVLPLVNGTLKLVPFLQTDFIYFTAIGLLMEWLKRKTGSLWIPILVHGIFDFIFVII